MTKKTKAPDGARPLRNPVAQHAGKFNRAVTHRDRTRYTRRSKHKGRDAFPVMASRHHRESASALKASGDRAAAVNPGRHFFEAFSAQRMQVVE